jgi:hypothetical protein
VVIRAQLEFSLLSTMKITDGHLLTLHLKNVGNRILKNLVVPLQPPDPKSSIDYPKHFVYALMPNTDTIVKFRVLDSSLPQTYFSVSGYANGDVFFSLKSPMMAVQTKDPIITEC